MSQIKYNFNKRFFIGFLVLYFIVNLLFLTRFPFVHSDESWLSGLSRNILEKKDFSVTETFFDLYERNPHAIKSIFHFVQILFLKIFGYNIFTFRLISLIFGILTLLYFYRLCNLLFKSERLALFSTIFLSLDTQFIYASHFARQEIILLFVLVLGLYVFYQSNDINNYYNDIFISILIGLSIGIHPNSFIISIPFGLLYLYYIFIVKKKRIKSLLLFISIISLFAIFFVLLSYKFDPNFLYNYTRYGDQFGVLNPITSKVEQTKDFYSKLYYGVSGTYFAPKIKVQFYLFSLILLVSLTKIFFRKGETSKEILISFILIILAINIGIITIGRFNQTSIVFLLPSLYILLSSVLFDFKNNVKYFGILIITVSLMINTTINVLPSISTSYDNYLKEIGRFVKSNDTVLANLNSEYYFENGKLYDYRNLAFLRNHNLSFKDYIYNRNIKYIIYSEEMDFIYNNRPLWNGVYGNPYYYYDDMKDFLTNNCNLIHEFKDNVYGIRIARYMNKRDWWIKIYKVKE